MSKKRAVITGINGQDGSYIAELLLEKDYEVHGIIRRKTNPNYENIKHIENELYLHYGDLTDQSSLESIFLKVKPHEIFNLGAQSFVGASWEIAENTIDITGKGAFHVVDAARKFSPHANIYQASSSEMFGDSNIEGLQDEETPFMPKSPYAASKLFAYHIGVIYRKSYQMFITNGILFNHESPRRGEEFVTKKIAKAVANISKGFQDHVKLGSLESRRDWGYAKDYVEAMWLMLQQPEPDDYVVATGKNHSVEDFAREAFKVVGIRNYKEYIRVDPKYIRPNELKVLKGKPNKAMKKLKWKPKVTFEELVKIMVEHEVKILE